MANAIPITKEEKPTARAKKDADIEIIGELPEGFEIPQGARRVIVGERKQVRVDF